jgi:hypothetical protein
MKPIYASVLLCTVLTACSQNEKPQAEIDTAAYRVQNTQDLQHKIDNLNTQLSTDFQNFKKTESLAFSDQAVLDVNNLKTLHLHAVSSTSLKPTKEAYCKMMNAYFNELYRLGHFNLNVLDGVVLDGAAQKDLKQKFATADAFYAYALSDYSSYKQAQQIMGFGCNLREALTPK